MAKYFATLTEIGEAKMARTLVSNTMVPLTEMAVGDGGIDGGADADVMPSAAQRALVRERHRRPLNRLVRDEKNASIVIAEVYLPEEVGGWWSRELGLYDEDGELFAVANVPPSYKPVLAEGSGRGQFFRMMLIHKAAGNIVLKIDPAVVVATREYVDDEVRDLRLALEEKADKATTLAGYGITDAVTVAQGLAAGIGADLSVTNGLVGDLNAVTEPGEYYYSATNANRPSTYGLLKVWREQLTTVYQVAHADTNDVYTRRLLDGVWAPWRKLAGTDSPEFTGTPRVPTPAIGDNSLQAANTAFVRAYVASAVTGNEVGRIFFEVRTLPRAGCLRLNGALLMRADYPELFAYAQGTGAMVTESEWSANAWGCFSIGDGESTFRLPEFRGEGLRCWDDGRGIDAKRGVGTWQDSQNRQHTHAGSSAAAGDHAHLAWTDAQGWHAHTGSTSVGGAHAHGVGGGTPVAPVGNWSYRDAGGTWSATSSTDGNHSHTVSLDGNGSHGHNVGIGANGSHSHVITINADGGTEARMRNVALLAMIRAF